MSVERGRGRCGGRGRKQRDEANDSEIDKDNDSEIKPREAEAATGLQDTYLFLNGIVVVTSVMMRFVNGVFPWQLAAMLCAFKLAEFGYEGKLPRDASVAGTICLILFVVLYQPTDSYFYETSTANMQKNAKCASLASIVAKRYIKIDQNKKDLFVEVNGVQYDPQNKTHRQWATGDFGRKP